MDGYHASLFGVPLVSGDKEQLLNEVTKSIQKERKTPTAVLFTPNPEQFVQMFHDPAFKALFQKSTWNIPDGQGVVWAVNRKRTREDTRRIQRIPGREVFHDLLRLSTQNNWSVLMVGGKPGSARQIAMRLQRQHPQIRALWDPGAISVARETDTEEQRVVSLIQQERPDMVFVAYGAPWQERWVMNHRDIMSQSGVRLAMVVGGSFEYEVGKVRPVPVLLESLHLECLSRLLLEPWRWKRQLKGGEFFARVLLGHAK